MSNNNGSVKMSTYRKYLGQVHKCFGKTSHREVKNIQNITYCYYHTTALCNVQVIKFNCLLI